MRPSHAERHLIDGIGWLRAAVLGANDRLVSTASPIVCIAASAAGIGENLQGLMREDVEIVALAKRVQASRIDPMTLH